MKTIPEVSKPYDGPKEIVQNEAQARFIENKIREVVNEEMARYNQQTAGANSNWESFHKQSQYLDMLIKVNDSGHKVHDEIDDAIKKLKELTYQ